VSLGMLTEELASDAMMLATALEDSQGQSGNNGGAGWQRVFFSVASAADAMKALLVKKAEECGAEIVLPVLDGFGELRTYFGRAARVEGMGDMGAVLTDLAGIADDFWWSCDKLGIPADTLPPRDRGSWVASWDALGPTGRVQMFLALLARGLLDIASVVSPWQPSPAETAPKQRKRA
jgi:hypothetical protein